MVHDGAMDSLIPAVEDLLRHLPKRQARVLRLRFGVGTDRRLTLEQIGARFGLSREMIRQIEQDALRKLRSLVTVPSDAIF